MSTEPHTVTIRERGSVIYTGTSADQFAAISLAMVTVLMQGVFAAERTLIQHAPEVVEMTISAADRTLHILIESASRLAARQADEAAFENIVSGYEHS